MVAGLLLLTACTSNAAPGTQGNSGPGATPAPTLAGSASPTASKAAPATAAKPAATSAPKATPAKPASAAGTSKIDACSALTLEDAKAVLGSTAKRTGYMEPGTSKSYETRCSYRAEGTDGKGFGLYMQVDARPDDADIGYNVRVKMATKTTEPVSGLGDKAVWAVEGVKGAGPDRALYIMKGNVFFWLTPTLWSWELADAKGLAQKVVSRLP